LLRRDREKNGAGPWRSRCFFFLRLKVEAEENTNGENEDLGGFSRPSENTSLIFSKPLVLLFVITVLFSQEVENRRGESTIHLKRKGSESERI